MQSCETKHSNCSSQASNSKLDLHRRTRWLASAKIEADQTTKLKSGLDILNCVINI